MHRNSMEGVEDQLECLREELDDLTADIDRMQHQLFALRRPPPRDEMLNWDYISSMTIRMRAHKLSKDPDPCPCPSCFHPILLVEYKEVVSYAQRTKRKLCKRLGTEDGPMSELDLERAKDRLK